ncbi:membrane protein insertion efficiency factor YidD [Luteococcus sanguinis]|uniref:Membrane protein insertion efficiency factor YidD n=1 Tax=Luteococcus sanguinis TaxID=174038 RepID=A0ABW1WZT9_9ACTN
MTASDAVLGAIRGYQRVISPRKGWNCAYGVHTGAGTCSSVIADAVSQRGVVGAVGPAMRQFGACASSARTLRDAKVNGVCCCGPIPIPFSF